MNPYLMLAAILGAALDGIENQMEPPSPVVGNAYAVEDLPQIPSSWEAAIDAMQGVAPPALDRIAPREPKTPEQILTDYINGTDESLDPMGSTPVDQAALLTQLETQQGIGNAPTLDAQGNQGSGDVGVGSQGNTQPLPEVGVGRGGNAATSVPGAGEIAPVGAAGAVDGAVAPPLTYGQQPTTTAPIEQRFTALTIPPEVKQRVAKKTDAELR